MQSDQQPEVDRRPPRERRRPLFLAAALLVPLVFLAGVELSLRAIGFGGSYPLFVDAPGVSGHRHASPDVMRRYYTGTEDAAAVIEPILFRSEKPTGLHRIVVQGGSTAAGFPYGRWGGLAGMLGDRLEASFPDTEIEVITTAMAAVNSYALLDLVDEIIEIEPDAVLIYAGHNEYLGVMGVASALGAGASREVSLLRLSLRRLRLYQLVEAAILLARGVFDSAGGADRQSLFALAAAGSLVPYGSEMDERGLAQLEANLGDILERYREAGIPVYVGTVVSNERDRAPFAGGPSEGVNRDVWQAAWRTHREHTRTGDDVQARAALQSLLSLDDAAADVWYALGRLEERAGDRDSARVAYQKARDRDRLRFRAPGVFNQRIRELTTRHGATLVDIEARFRDASPGGIVGDELLLEHVHPNAEGYFLLAAAYYDALARDGRIGDGSAAPNEEQARRDMPITRVDHIIARYDTGELQAGFPFRENRVPYVLPVPANEIEAIAQRLRGGETEWIQAMDELMQIHLDNGEFEEAAVVARLGAQAYPFDHATNFAAGTLLLQLDRPAQARRYLERSLRAKPGDTRSLKALAQANRQLPRFNPPGRAPPTSAGPR